MTSKRYPQIDWMYFIGTVLVVLGHSHYSDWTVFQGTWFEQLLIFIYKFHMPMFFSIAGFLFLSSGSLEKKGIFKWIKEKTYKLSVPYLVLSFIALFPKFYIEHRSFSGAGLEIVNTLFVPRLGVWGHLWFLPVLLLCYILFAFWKKFFYKKKQTAVLIVTFIISAAIYFIPLKTQVLGIDDLKSSLLFFSAGMLAFRLYEYTVKIKKPVRITVSAICIISVVLLNKFLTDSIVLNLITGLLMILLCWQISCVLDSCKAVSWFSKHNFTVYLYSWPVQSVVMFICDRINLQWYIAGTVMFIAGIGIPVLMALIYDKTEKIQNRFFDMVLGVK